MDLIKVPPWWDRKDNQFRPNTVDPGAQRVVRSRAEMLYEQKRQSLPFYTVQDNNQEIPFLESNSDYKDARVIKRYQALIPAGHRPPSRDARDKVTTCNNEYQLNEVDLCKYSTLTALKAKRLSVEREDCQKKMNFLHENKTLLSMKKSQIFDEKARQRVKPKLKSSQSTREIRERPQTGDPTMQYVENPPVKTQKKLFEKRKKEFLADMKKCEQVYANHRNAEQRLNLREVAQNRESYKVSKPKVKIYEEFEPNVKYGIHTKPLPHFAKHHKQWWIMQSGY